MRLGRIKRGFVALARPIGGLSVTNYLARRSPRILMYHRFAESHRTRRLSIASFEGHLRRLKRDFDVMTMGELVDRIRDSGQPPSNAAVITVDDGHRDFHDLAAPLLRKYELPATLFLTTRFSDGDFWLWPDRLEYALMRSSRHALDLGAQGCWPLADEAARWRAWQEIVELCVRRSDVERDALLCDVIERLDVALPLQPPSDYAAVDWREAAQLQAQGIEIGGHTRTHPILSRMSEERLDDEIGGCKRDIEQRLGTEAVSFCYPNGAPEDISLAVKAAVRRAGFRSAVAAYFSENVLSDLYEIKRYGATDNERAFEERLYGVKHTAVALRARLGL